MVLALVAASAVLFSLRLWAALRVGFGDSEALYASWALHPQAAYLDHPGLVGLVARAIGDGGAPSPVAAHLVTAVLATLFPWLVVLIARAARAPASAAAAAGLVVAVVPEIGVGLFALTPDLLLAYLWLAAIGLAIVGLSREKLAPLWRDSAFLGAGLLSGVAASAKVSGLLLALALAVTYARTRSARRLYAPWAGLAAGAVVLEPIAVYEVRLGFPMLRHRLVDTQIGAGVTLRNAGALVGGQLVYLSPVVVALAAILARDLWRRRKDDVVSELLFFTLAIPLGPLVALCLWSPVAEPHWIAPALLALPIHAARNWDAARGLSSPPFGRSAALRADLRPRLVRAAAAVAAAFTLAAHLWVLVPASSALLPAGAAPKVDIASELYGWPEVFRVIQDELRAPSTPFDRELPDPSRDVVVVGPHWTICAQLHAALAGVRVGCATPVPDDFDRWLPRASWRQANDVLFVTDNRFAGNGSEQLPAHALVRKQRIRTRRGGRTSRIFDLYLYARQQQALKAY